MDKFVLAYSGGLDTSIIVPWLKEHYTCQVICVCVNTGNLDNSEVLQKRAEASGASKLVIVDAREQFVTDYLFPMLRARASYEEKYLLGTSIARPLQAGHQVRVAMEEKAVAVVHGCTGKGNDQIRFELTYRALAPHLKVIAPWREWDIDSRESAIQYAKERDISLDGITKKNIYSRDANLWHMSHEGGALEDLREPIEISNDIYRLTASPVDAPDKPEELSITFERSVPVAVNGKKLSPVDIIETLNATGGRHAIGRVDIVEGRVIGMKSRGLYETPAGTLLYAALRELESLTLDSELWDIKRQLAEQYGKLVYAGKWYSPLRQSLDAFMERAARNVTGTITLSLYKGGMYPVRRSADVSLYRQDVASFSTGQYSNEHAGGFVRLYGLPTEHIAAQSPARVPADAGASEVYDFGA